MSQTPGVLERLGNAGKEKHGQDRSVLQADNSAARVGWPRHDDVVLKVWMADAEATESRILRDQWRDTAPSAQCESTATGAGKRAFPRRYGQDWLSELPQVSHFLVRCCYESCFGVFIYSCWWVQGHNHGKTGNDIHGPRLMWNTGGLFGGRHVEWWGRFDWRRPWQGLTRCSILVDGPGCKAE